jgi:hypothetical protein
MTVIELVEQLTKFPPDYEVRIDISRLDEFRPVQTIMEYGAFPKKVFIGDY